MFHGSSRILRTWAAGLAMAAIAGLVSPGTAGAQQAPTPGPAYTVTFSALVKSGNRSDVTIRIVPPSGAPPASAKQLVVKALKADGVKVDWQKTYANVALNQGVVSYAYGPPGTALMRLQQLRVQVTIQTPAMMKPQIYSASGQGYYSPDLAIQSPPAPVATPTLVDQPAMIRVWVSEVLGDTGGTCDVELLNGSTSLDRVPAVSVPAGKPSGKKVEVVLAAKFASAGTYTLGVRVRNSSPSEYDDGNGLNNLTNVTIVVETSVPATFPESPFMSYYNVVSRDCQLVEKYDPSGTILLGTEWDSGTDSLFDSLLYQVRLSFPLTAAGFRVNVWTGAVQRISAFIPVDRPSSSKETVVDGTRTISMNWFYSLTPDESDRVSLVSTLVQAPDGSVSGDGALTFQHDASEHHYFSAKLFFGAGQPVNYTGEDYIGTVWGAKESILADIRVIELTGLGFIEHRGASQIATLELSSQDVDRTIPPTEEIGRDGFVYKTTTEFHSTTWSGTGTPF